MTDAPRRGPYARLAAIVLAGAVLRILCFRGYCSTDDGVYAEIAHRMATGTFHVSEQYSHVPVFQLRLALLAPAALLFKWLGAGQWTLAAYPFAMSLAGIVLTFVATRWYFGERAGLIAAALAAALPCEMFLATVLLPDLPATVLTVGAILSLCRAFKSSGGAERAVWGGLAGLLFGVSWLTKESLLVYFPFVAGFVAVNVVRRKGNLLAVTSAGVVFLAILAGEAALYYPHTHDLLHRLHETSRNYEVCKVLFFSENGTFGWGTGGYAAAVARRLLLDGPRAILLNPYLGFVTTAALIAIVYAWRRRLRGFAFAGLWFISMAIMLNFMTSSFESYIPLVLYDRYLYVLVFPSVMLAASLLDQLLARPQPDGKNPSRAWRRGGILLAGGIGCMCVAGVAYGAAMTRAPAGPLKEISRITTPVDAIYADSYSARALEFFWNFPPDTQVRVFDAAPDMIPPRGAYVIVNRERLNFATRNYAQKFPAFCDSPPANWRQILGYKGVTLFQVRGD